MKRILLFLSALFIATTAIAHTINWYVDGNIFHTTTCESGENVTPPTAPEKYGYTFREWKSYTPIEYLESTGTQYIDTGFVPTTNTRIDFEFSYAFEPVNNVGQVIFGSRTTGTYNTSTDQMYAGCNIASDGVYFYSGPTYTFIQSPVVANNFYKKIVINSRVTGTAVQPIYMYALNLLGTAAAFSKIKIKYFQIYDNDTLVRDFVPVLDKDDIPCMYDKVERKFYYNQGTGDFIAGPIIGE